MAPPSWRLGGSPFLVLPILILVLIPGSILAFQGRQTTNVMTVRRHDRISPLLSKGRGSRRIRPPFSSNSLPLPARKHSKYGWASSTRLRVLLPEETTSEEAPEDTLSSDESLNGEVHSAEDTTTTTTTTTTTKTQKSDRKGRQAGAATTMELRPRSTTEPASYYWNYWNTVYELGQAGLVGSFTGLSVAMFKLSIEFVRRITYEQPWLETYPALICLIPALGGIVVGLLLLLGDGTKPNQAFPPGLRGTVQESDQQLDGNSPSLTTQFNFVRKSTASVATLGTGNSLGPEGPCVEIGLNVARACTRWNRPSNVNGLAAVAESSSPIASSNTTTTSVSQRQWNRVLLSCGAAAGVAAGFNAPLAGVFFALEIMQNTFKDVDSDNAVKALKKQQQKLESNSNAQSPISNLNTMLLPPALVGSMTDSTTITPILISSVISALLSQILLGNHLILTLAEFDLATPLVELPLYLLLGALSGVVAFVFTYLAKISNQVFAGEFAPLPDSLKSTMQQIPDAVKPVIGGLLCGLVGLVFPQILFFGYETLNALLKDNGELSLSLILSLMGVKTVMTAVAAGSGLVGGTFAPSLFLGGMLGCAFHEVVSTASESIMHWQVVFDSSPVMVDAVMNQGGVELNPEAMHIAGVPAYAMVGAASVLAALFRAPLTASLLLFEVTRNYDVILPLMASAGVGSIVGDILEDRFERPNEMQRRDRDPVSWGDLSFPDWKAIMEQKEDIIDSPSVEAGAYKTQSTSQEDEAAEQQ